MDKFEIIKAILPFIPAGYRRPLLFYIHFEEMLRIMDSLRACLNMRISGDDSSHPADFSGLLNTLKQNMSKQDSDMLNMLDMLSSMKNMGDMTSDMAGMMSAFNFMNNTDNIKNANNTNSTNDMNDTNTSTGSDNSGEAFSEELDDLFKDFLNETKGDDINE